MIEHPDPESLRPLERRVLAMRHEGVALEEIAERLRRSPEFVERVIEWTQIPRKAGSTSSHLSALEKRVLELSARGEDHATIARRFRRSERFIRQVEGMAHFRKGLRMMSTAAAEARAAEESRA